MFLSTSKFITDVLPGLMWGRDRFSALLATYNDFGDLSAVPHRQPGLEITCRSGNLLYRIEPGSPLATVDSQMERQASAVVESLEQATEPDEHYDLSIVYLGLTGFQRALQYARALRMQCRVGENVVVLTCDCLKEDKTQALEPQLKARNFLCALMTPTCGGKEDLQELHEGILKTWPRVRSQRAQ